MGIIPIKEVPGLSLCCSPGHSSYTAACLYFLQLDLASFGMLLNPGTALLDL